MDVHNGLCSASTRTYLFTLAKVAYPSSRMIRPWAGDGWLAANAICAKRLVPFLPVLVPQLERHGHLHLTDRVRADLLTLTPATADRLLRTARADHHLRGKSTTKSGTLLKKQIPIRTFQDWNDLTPGFVEAGLVAHCGGVAEGAFLCTLTVTDVATGWVECQALLLRSQHTVIQAMERVRQLLPFPLLGVDTDNGSEFINEGLLAWCAQAEVTFTRGRIGKSNEQCFVEQKNGAVVRQIVGYDRFEGQHAYQQLAELYRAVRLYVNLFQPSVKLQAKTRDGARTTRRYDHAQTPLQRVVASAVLTSDQLSYLDQLFATLDPVHLLRQISLLQDALWRHAVAATVPVAPLALPPAALAFAQTHGLGPHAHPPAGGLGLDATTLPKVRSAHRSTTAQPRLYCTRVDPFADVWEDVCVWLAAQPERTAKSLFHDLQGRYPGRFPDVQLRTLQRRGNIQRIAQKGAEKADRAELQGKPQPLMPTLVPAHEGRHQRHRGERIARAAWDRGRRYTGRAGAVGQPSKIP